MLNSVMQPTHTHAHVCACVRMRPVCLHVSGCQACFMGHPQRLCYHTCVFTTCIESLSQHTHTRLRTRRDYADAPPLLKPCSEPRQQRNQSDLTGHPCANHSRGINEHFLCFENTATLVHHTDRDIQLLKTSKGGMLERKKTDLTITHLYPTF